MPFKNVGLTVYLKAWDNDNACYKTGYHASITPRGCGDGTMFTPAGAVSEVSAAFYPGLYKITYSDAENNYDVNAIGGSAADSTITIHGMEWMNIPIDFNTTQKASINTEADTAISDYDPPTRAELTADKNSIITEVNANEAKIDIIDTNIDALTPDMEFHSHFPNR